MDNLMCEYLGMATPRECCTFDKESQTEPDDFIECGEICQQYDEQGCEACPLQKIFAKLYAYEKTGLTPEQIVEMDALYAEKCKELAEIQKGIGNVKEHPTG